MPSPSFRKTKQAWVKIGNPPWQLVKGVTLGNRQETIRAAEKGMKIRFKREPRNRYDSNAIALYLAGKSLGYLPAETSEWVAREMDSGEAKYESRVAQVWPYEVEDGKTIWMMKVTLERYKLQEVEMFAYGKFLAWYAGRFGRWALKILDGMLAFFVGEDEFLLKIARPVFLFVVLIGCWIFLKLVF